MMMKKMTSVSVTFLSQYVYDTSILCFYKNCLSLCVSVVSCNPGQFNTMLKLAI